MFKNQEVLSVGYFFPQSHQQPNINILNTCNNYKFVFVFFF